MRGEAGTECTLRALFWDGPLPEEGDFLRTDAGSCYQILGVRESATPRATIRATFSVRRLGKDAVEDGAPGVWRWEFSPR